MRLEDFSHSFSQTTDLLGTFGSLSHHLRDTLATECLLFSKISSFLARIASATWKTFSPFARKTENEKLIPIVRREMSFRESYFPLNQHTRATVVGCKIH